MFELEPRTVVLGYFQTSLRDSIRNAGVIQQLRMVEALKQQPGVIGFAGVSGHLGTDDRALDNEHGCGGGQLGLAMTELPGDSFEKLLQLFLMFSRDREGLAVKLSAFGHRIDKCASAKTGVFKPAL